MKSAMEMSKLQAFSLMIPKKDLFMISYDEVIDKFKLQLILEKGYSRIPVFNKNNRDDIIGILRIKNLIGVDFNQNRSLKQIGIELRPPIVLSPTANLIDLLKELRKGKSHLALITEEVKLLQQKLGLNARNSVISKEKSSDRYFISNKYKSKDDKRNPIKILGLVTLEDVLEKVINLDIMDEDDYDEAEANKSKIFDRPSGSNKIFLINTLVSKRLTNELLKNENHKLNTLFNYSSVGKKNNFSYNSVDSPSLIEMTKKNNIAGFDNNMKDKLLD